MDIQIKETMYVSVDGKDHCVRHGSYGVLRGNVYHFYDTTKTVSLSFDKDFCLETPSLFQVSRTLKDREIPIKQVVAMLESVTREEVLQNPEILRILAEKIKTF